MNINQNTHFYVLSLGTIVFLFTLISEFSYNLGIISNYSITMLFFFLTIFLAVLIVFSVSYVKRFNDKKGKALLFILILSGIIFLFFLIVNLLVMV
ncbi:glucan phosphoethanolaminetransferase (alkaline phosphatase superfamily) [Bacillus ectoiniformans]|nr:glucan phosphoethanolaminetransferase (alkaline phosphatase superfamily) [Bacillus ectoiniformans]